MSRISLKNLLSPRADVYGSVTNLLAALKANLWVEDAAQKPLLGEPQPTAAFNEKILHDEELLGWVKGDGNVPLVASLINLLVTKEGEKKKLGQEVLVLYQEVNLIFNFSEKLAQTLGQTQIAAITLEEARRLIKSDQGVIVLWSSASGSIEVLATSGESIFDEQKLKVNMHLLQSISHSGLSEIMGDLTPLKEAGVIGPEVRSLIYAALKVNQRVLGAIILASTDPIQYAAADLKYLITLALQSSSAMESAWLYEKNIREAKEREEAMRNIYEIANKFVPHEFIRSLGRSVFTDIQLGDKVEKIVTVLFSDIRDYTTLSEQMTPDENFMFVCSFNEKMGPIIRKHNGFINQYLGDAIMAIFPGPASDALAAAVEMQNAVQVLNAERLLAGKLPIKIGVGMHTGPLIMGITGDHERLDAATISDTVNTASRLEGLTKHYKVNILMSEASVNSLVNPDAFHFRKLGWIQLKGKLAPVSIYECFNGSDGPILQNKLSALPYYTEAVAEYYSKSFATASDKFHRVLTLDPEDMASNLFLEKARQYITAGIPENWTGVEEMHSK